MVPDHGHRRPLVDDLGAPVTLAGTPRRVVSLVPSLTEAIAVTQPGVLVGVTDWCTHPGDLDAVRLRGPKNPDVAAIVALRPDLVVANQEENRCIDVERLRAAGVPVWVTRICDLDEAFASLNRLFREAFGLAETPGWLRRADAEWAGPPVSSGLRVAVPVWRDPWLWVGSGTYAHDLLTRLGWSNSAAAFGDGYPKAGVDRVLAKRPEMVLLPDEPYPFCASDGPEAFGGVPTRLVPGRALFWFGPAMVEARRVLEALAGSPNDGMSGSSESSSDAPA